MRADSFKMRGQKLVKRKSVRADLGALLSIEHACHGCAKDERCCCAAYEVCVSAAEMERIIQVLPDAAEFCPHLGTDKGYDNVFEKVSPGLYAIDTTEDGLCLFAYETRGKVHCSLHTVALDQGLPLARVKPKACILWPLSFSEGDEVLSITDDALSFNCNTRKVRGRRSPSAAFIEAIEMVYGEGCGAALEQAAGKKVRSVILDPRQ
jgi:hypothetical protein